jgi:hypothetical protein
VAYHLFTLHFYLITEVQLFVGDHDVPPEFALRCCDQSHAITNTRFQSLAGRTRRSVGLPKADFLSEALHIFLLLPAANVG